MYYCENSIIIPVYNAQEHIEKTVEAFFGVFDNTEMILVDDCSTDCTWQIIQNLKYKYNIIPVRLKKNVGQHLALFCGFYFYSGKYILTTDDDLVINPIEFKKCLFEFKKSKYDLIILTYKKNKEIGQKIFNLIYKYLFKLKNDGSNHKIIKASLVEDIKAFYASRIFLDTLLIESSESFRFYHVDNARYNQNKSRLVFYRKLKYTINMILHYVVWKLFLHKKGDRELSKERIKQLIYDEGYS